MTRPPRTPPPTISPLFPGKGPSFVVVDSGSDSEPEMSNIPSAQLVTNNNNFFL